jgi:hypothetical protein
MIRPPEEMAATVQRVFVCFAEFLFVLQRGAAAAVRKNSHGRGVLGGYSGGTREYYWGPAGVLPGYYYSRCSPEEHSSIPLTANWKGSTSYRGQRHGIAMRLLGVALLSTAPVSTRLKVFRVHLVAPNRAVVIPCQVTMDNTNKSMLGLGQDPMAEYSTHPSWSRPPWPNLGANGRLFGPHVSLTAAIDSQLHGASRVGRSTAGNCGLRGGRAGASGASATFLSKRVCRRSAPSHARRLTPLAIAASGRAGTSAALRCCRIRISSAGDDDSAARCTPQRK